MAEAKTDIKDLPLDEQVDQLRKQFVVAVMFAFGLLCGYALGKDK